MADSHQDPMTQKRQAIVDELQGLVAERMEILKAASAVIDAKRDALVRQCGDLGHVFGKAGLTPLWDRHRLCVFCGAAEPEQAKGRFEKGGQ